MSTCHHGDVFDEIVLVEGKEITIATNVVESTYASRTVIAISIGTRPKVDGNGKILC